MTTKDSELPASQDVMLILVGGFLGLLIGGVGIGLMPLEGYGRRIALASWSFIWFLGMALLISVGRSNRRDRLGLNQCAWRWCGLGFVAGSLSMPLAGWVASSLRHAFQDGIANPQLDYVLLTHAPVWAQSVMAFLIVVALPFGEEVLYRGVLFDALVRMKGAKYAVFMSAAIFGLMHFDLAISVATAVLGLLYGLLRKVSNSIYPSFLAHMANNGLAYWIANAAN